MFLLQGIYLKRANRNKGDSPGGGVAVEVVEKEEKREEYLRDVLTVSKGMNTISQDEWLLDSSYPIHICSKRVYFDSFQEEKIGFVSLSDGSICDITGVGMVKIKMFNGVVLTLGGVVHVPKIQRNLISLVQLDSIGYRWSHENHMRLFGLDEGRKVSRWIVSFE